MAIPCLRHCLGYYPAPDLLFSLILSYHPYDTALPRMHHVLFHPSAFLYAVLTFWVVLFICLANSYSTFNTQPKCHLVFEAFFSAPICQAERGPLTLTMSSSRAGKMALHAFS